jgi:hypothetical protein
MKRIDKKTVHLTHREAVAYDFFHEMLDIGKTIQQAVAQIETFGRRNGRYSPEFLAYLAQ